MKIKIGIFLLLLILIVIATSIIRQAIRQARTYDTIGMIEVAISKSLTVESWANGYDAVKETRRIFPIIKTANGFILDEWNTPIHIEIRRLPKSFSIRIVSAGKDRTFGTVDDCIREGVLSDGKP
jgi:hypothetical protein